VSNLIAWDLDFNLTPAVSAAAARLPIPIAPESQAACLSFISERLRNWLLEGKARFDVVDAVLVSLGKNPAAAHRAVKELTAWVERPDWHKILPAYARCVRITRDQPERFTVDPAAFVEAGERELYKVLSDAEAKMRAPGSVDDFLNAFLPMIPAINRFFDEVLVMDELAIHRQNRLGMLQRISALAEGVADMSRLEGF
jgi:glycyl-tRNA synthetase